MNDDDLLRMKALLLVQAADISSVLKSLQELEKMLPPDLRPSPGVTQTFLTQRRHILHAMLEDYETKNPALAAKMQQMIDTAAQQYPFDY